MRAFGDSISKVVVIVADYIALPVVFVDVVYGESVGYIFMPWTPILDVSGHSFS